MTAPFDELRALRRRWLAELSAEDLQTPTARAARLKELESLDGLISRLEPRRPAWRRPAILALLAISAVLFASVIRWPSARVDLTAETVSLGFMTAAVAPAAAQSRHPLRVSGVHAGAAALEDVRVLTRLTFGPGAVARVDQASDGCLTLSIAEGYASAEAVGDTPAGGVPIVRSFRVDPRTPLAFCPQQPAPGWLMAPVAAVTLATVQDEGPPRLLGPALRAGTLTVGETGRQIALGRLERVTLDGIADGTLLLGLEPQLRVNLSGRSRSALAVGPRGEVVRNLRPTLLDLFTHAPLWRTLLAAFTGTLGVLWSVWRYFSAA